MITSVFGRKFRPGSYGGVDNVGFGSEFSLEKMGGRTIR
jgi:hypothetical protein